MTTVADNPNRHVVLDPACGGYHDRRMACPMYLIASVAVEEIRNQAGVIVDRRITVTVDCGCEYELSLPLTTRAPRRGEPSHCRGAHER